MTTSSRRLAVILAGHAGDIAGARSGLGDPDPKVRASALGALARAGDLGDADLGAALADPASRVRCRALALATDRPGLGLVPLLDDPDPVVVEQAAWACGERASPEPGAVAALATLATTHPDALIREAAVAALGAIGDEDGLAAILVATTDIARVRRRAVLALAPFTGPEVDAALTEARADRDIQVRQAGEDVSPSP